jgi:anti-anti-sigma factor
MELRFEPQAKPTGVVVVQGRLDLLAAAALKTELQRLVSDGWCRLVVDLEGVPFIDSSGLGGLIGGLKSARVAGGDFRIAMATEQVRYILKVSTLDQVLTPYSTVNEALEGYQ